ncbi:MAG: hypothetical protein ACRDCC_08290 [Culicoidibacterales bacterium]
MESTFLNENGTTYQVVNHFKFREQSLALLLDKESNQYVVADGLKGNYWESGNYFGSNQESALNYFNDKVAEKTTNVLIENALADMPKVAYEQILESESATIHLAKSDFEDEFTMLFEQCGLIAKPKILDKSWQTFTSELEVHTKSIEQSDSYTVAIELDPQQLYVAELQTTLGGLAAQANKEQTIDETVQTLELMATFTENNQSELLLEGINAKETFPKLVNKLKEYPDQELSYAKAKYPDVPITALQTAYDNNFTNATINQDRFMKLFELANDIDTPEHILQNLAAMNLDGISDEAIMNQNFDATKDLYDFCDVTEAEVKKLDKTNENER